MKRTPPLCCPPPPRNEGRGLKVRAGDRGLAALAKALGHPARVRIVRRLLALKGCACGDLVRELGLAQATVSQHLKVLKAAGLIYGSIQGPSACYCLDGRVLKAFREELAGLG